jgi:hypothetical protein
LQRFEKYYSRLISRYWRQAHSDDWQNTLGTHTGGKLTVMTDKTPLALYILALQVERLNLYIIIRPRYLLLWSFQCRVRRPMDSDRFSSNCVISPKQVFLFEKRTNCNSSTQADIKFQYFKNNAGETEDSNRWLIFGWSWRSNLLELESLSTHQRQLRQE